MKRSVGVAVASALFAGAAAGALAVSASETPSASAGPPGSDLTVVSRWSGPTYRGGPTVRLLSGSLTDDPGRGVVLIQQPGLKPAFFATREKTGALRLLGMSSGTWTLRSARGSLVVAEPGYAGPGVPASFAFLGPRLDPRKLGAIGPRGVAVEFDWGPWLKARRAHTAVVLVEPSPSRSGSQWTVDGYLAGFSLAHPDDQLKMVKPVLGTPRELEQPLVGPDGRLYAIDATAGRLVPAPQFPSAVAYRFGQCTTWPGADGASYRACPNTIVLRKAGGSSSVVFRRHLGKWAFGGTSWVFVEPSPDGKWLLTQDAYGACGIATWAYFVRAGGGGQLIPAFPGAYTSEALGWLPDNTALVAAQSEGCDGSPTSGIYQVWPGNPTFEPPPQLVFPGFVFDATTWGYR